MPTVNPPLGRETKVPIASSDADRFVHLHFTLTFEPAEDSTGSWELWTDIADVNDDGHVIADPGEWRSVSFVHDSYGPHPAEEVIHQDAPSDSSRVLALPSMPLTPIALPAKTGMSAEMVVPAKNASYAYTYRRVLTSGETQWLGNGGDNGVVRVFEGEMLEQSKAPVEWKGVGIELPSDGSTPVIHELPNDEGTRASILLLRSMPPAFQPIFQLADKPTKTSAVARSSLVILSNCLEPVAVEAKATNPVASGIKYHHDDHRSLSAILKAACREQTQVQPGSDGLDGEVVSLLYCPEQTPTTAYLITYAPELQQQRSIKPLLPTLASDKAPIALRIVDTSDQAKSTFVPAQQIPELVLNVGAGKVASVLEINQFIALPTHPDAWIAGVGSLIQHVIEEPIVPASKMVAPLLEPVDEVGSESPSTEVTAESLSTEMTKSISNITDSQSEALSTDSERSVILKTETSSVLHFLRRFFLSLWSWLFGPFTSTNSVRRGAAAREDATIESSSGVQTPHERTPLLGQTPRVSQSPSSTAVSAFGSPQKQGATMLKSDSAASAESSTSTVHDLAPVPARSALVFTFARSPFHFLVNPGLSTQIYAQLNFTYRRTGNDAPITTVKPTRFESENGGECDELVIEAEEGKGPWEVRVEM